MSGKIGVIIQARSGSKRLPNKIHLPLPKYKNVSILENVVNRCKQSKLIDKVIIATTTNKSDDLVEKLGKEINVSIYRGDEDNVLSRYYYAAKKYNIDTVVRITGDCPFIDYRVIDKIIEEHKKNGNDYTSNTLERTFPHGMDTEVFSFSVLHTAFEEATKQYEIEHVTPFIYKTNFKKYQIQQITREENMSNIRITLDTEDDYLALCALYDQFKIDDFSCEDIIDVYKEKDWLFSINNKIEQKQQYTNFKEEVIATLAWCEKQDLYKMTKHLRGVLDEITNTN